MSLLPQLGMALALGLGADPNATPRVSLGAPTPLREVPPNTVIASAASQRAPIVRAQNFEAPPPPVAQMAPMAPYGDYGAPIADPAFSPTDVAPRCVRAPRIWGSADFLYLWIKDSPISVPLVTTSTNPADFGIIGQPTTAVLFGNQNADFGGMPGVRLTLGGWFDQDHIIGAEATGFYLFQQNVNFSATSDAAGNPTLAVPALETTTNTEAAFVFASPLIGSPGNVSAQITSRFWGAEANGLLNVWRDHGIAVCALGGFRYLDLRETLSLSGNSNNLFILPFGVPVGPAAFQDNFNATNHFYGGNLGLKGEFSRGWFYAAIAGKVALGINQQTLNVSGSNTVLNDGAGIFARGPALGSRSSTPFTIVPEVQAKVGVNIGQHVRLTVGYDFLYISSVVRPGNNIDRGIDAANNPPTRPAALFNQTSFWAQGVNAGLEIRF